MRLVRFEYRKNIAWGILESGFVKALKEEPFLRIKPTAKKFAFSTIRLLPPVFPQKIVLVGLNYLDHAKELGMSVPVEPIIFLKPPTAVIGHGEKITYPQGATRVDYEAELAVVMKKEAKSVSEENVKDYILGYTCLNDVTERNLQKKDIQWTRAKSFDTFCPLGPWIETAVNPEGLKIKSYLNGNIKQDSSTANFIFSIPYLISFISKIMTLLPGDVVSTGTPAGVGQMQRGDIITIEIEGIGRLENKVF